MRCALVTGVQTCALPICRVERAELVVRAVRDMVAEVSARDLLAAILGCADATGQRADQYHHAQRTCNQGQHYAPLADQAGVALMRLDDPLQRRTDVGNASGKFIGLLDAVARRPLEAGFVGIRPQRLLQPAAVIAPELPPRNEARETGRGAWRERGGKYV